MRKIMVRLVESVVVLVIISIAALQMPFSQDWLFERLSKVAMTPQVDEIDGMRVVVCGSASPLGIDPNRAQACIAVLTQDHFFVFDSGAGSAARLTQAGLPLRRLNGVFLTHFHSDHIAALPDVVLASWVMGRPQSLEVHGPVGVDIVVNGFNAAYRLDNDYRTKHHGQDFLPPAAGRMTAVTIEPGVVWERDGFKVTAFTVDHSPIAPAVGYRVDYAGRSIVVSGDTVVVNSLFTAAKGADLLFHDALSRQVLDQLIESADATGRDRVAHIMRDVIDYHADVKKIESKASAAKVKQLVLYHMVPVPANFLTAEIFRRDLTSETILAEDLMVFDLAPNSRTIVQSKL